MKLSLYRKYRPQTFDEVAGQNHVGRTLKNAVESNAVAHAYIFAGPRGIGKTSMAKILAKALNCQKPGPDGAPIAGPTVEPCGACDSCRAIAASTSLDVIEMDAASNRGIDDIRDLREKVGFTPVQGRAKVYIIDEAHMLTKEAFNALLKTLEEPPPHVVFVLATTEPHKIPETIVSRCQRFDFRRPLVQEIVAVLHHIVSAENVEIAAAGGDPVKIDEPALREIARHAQGGFRDAIGTLDKLITFADGPIAPSDVLDALGAIGSDMLLEITDIVVERDAAAALAFVQRLAERGTNYSQFIRDLLRHLRQLFLLQHVEGVSEDPTMLRALGQNVELDEQLLEKLLPQANQLPPAELVYFIEALGQAQTEIQKGLDPRLQLELALVKVSRPQVDASASGLEERLRRLEAGTATGLTSGGAAARPAKPAPGGRAAPVRVASDAEPSPPAAPPGEAPEPAAETTGAGATVEGAESGAPAEHSAETPTPVPSAPASEVAELTIDRVKRAWELILQQLNTASPVLFGTLRDARPRALADGCLTIAMSSEFALTTASSEGNQAIFAEAVAQTLGHEVILRFELANEAAPAGPSTSAPAAHEALTDAQVVARLVKELDAEPLPDDQ